MPEREPEEAPDRPDAPGRAAPPPDPAPDLELPAAFGKYFLTEKLATGGMAEIYLAKIIGPGGFEKPLVIKQIHPRLSGQRHFVDLFVAEAKTLVTLAHGNIVPVYELGVIDDTYFIAMEYIDGPTLYRLTETLRRRGVRMDPTIAAWITARILEGLDYAHRKGEGVIHRDLSPRNVMLSRDGEVKLVDFGIAVTLGDGGEDDAGQSAPTGSFPYMSPEQVRKEPLTAQSDLFSVGVLCWEMLVGHRLFARPDADATLSAVLGAEIARPSRENPEVPARLDEVVMRALERDRSLRWASAEDMRAQLQRYLYSLDVLPGPRDVAALVAKYCPPETRRLPTHHDETEPPQDATRARARRAATDAEPRPGPATAVIPRDGAPRGKRAPRARTETFATHVALDKILERAAPSPAGSAGPGGVPGPDPAAPSEVTRAPSSGSGGDGDAARGDPTPPRPRANGQPESTDTSDASDASEGSSAPAGPPVQLPGRVPPSAALLVLAGIGALALGGAALFVFFQGREAVLRPDASPRHDARIVLPPGPEPAPDAAEPPADAPPPVDAGAPAILPATPDARPSAPRHDAGGRPVRPDVREPGAMTTHADAGVARPTGTATLTIGANPWGNVLLDGKKIGRTPIERLSVPAGHHVVEVIFSGEDPPRSQRFPLDLDDGDARDVLADFTRP